MMNSVGFYQIAKLLIIPFTAVVEALWLGEWLTMSQTACTALVVAGVAVVYAPLAIQ
jgi:solute carrier family 35, member E3